MEKENPFSPTFPCHPKNFVNRIEILESFRRAFQRSVKTSSPTPDNLAIFGDWGLGKTSLLRKFESLAVEESKERNSFSSIVELVPSYCNSLYTLKTKIVDDVGSNFVTPDKILPELRTKVQDWKFKSDGNGNGNGNGKHRVRIGNIETRNIHEKNLKDVLVDLWHILEHEGIETAVLMLDDLHYLAEKYPDGLYELWNTFQNLPKHGCNFMLCVTGTRELLTDEKFSDPLRFFNITHTLRLFTLKETKEVILKPIDFLGTDIEISDDVVERIYELTLGHPFFIHFIMRELTTFMYSKQKEVTLETFSALTDEKFSGNKITLNYFEEKYPALREMMENEKLRSDFHLASNKEREILLEMSKLPQKFSPSEIPIKDARTQLRFLLKKNLIARHDRGTYSLYHPFFREYLRGISNK